MFCPMIILLKLMDFNVICPSRLGMIYKYVLSYDSVFVVNFPNHGHCFVEHGVCDKLISVSFLD